MGNNLGFHSLGSVPSGFPICDHLLRKRLEYQQQKKDSRERLEVPLLNSCFVVELQK